MRGSLTPQRLSKLLVLVSQFRLGRRLELVQYQRLLGTMSAAAAVVPLGLLRARPLQRWLNAFNLHPRQDRRVKLKVTRPFRHALRPWRDQALLSQGAPLGNIPSRSDHRRLPNWMGCSLGRQDSSGYMEFPLEGRAYKCAGAEGSSSCPSGTSPPYQGQTCPSEIG